MKHHTFFQKLLLSYVTKNPEKIMIQLDTMKNYIEKNNIKKIDLCKIDVEGAELDVLIGFENYINIVDTFIIEIENFNPGRTQKIKNILKNFNIQNDLINNNDNWIMLIAKNKWVI